jgi:hypothetical protein
MCFFLYVASPLTLSEIRSMLPAGFTADLAPLAEQAALRALHPAARTGVRLLLGACSCDLVLARSGSREDERELRRRYFAAGLSRMDVIAALERHRRGGGPFDSPAAARSALAGFVAEHARNAGPTLYLLRFGREPLDRRPPQGPPVRLRPDDLAGSADGWLVEERPVLIGPRL